MVRPCYGPILSKVKARLQGGLLASNVTTILDAYPTAFEVFK
jgi:hypothetical protein